jgi:hypothetical protein
MDPSLHDLERTLAGIRPRPRAEFVTGLERDLKRSLRTQQRHVPRLRLPRLVVATASAGAIAVLVLALAIAGALPLNLGGARKAAADRDCTTVTEWRLEHQPRLKVTESGKLRIIDTTVLVPQRVIRCH